jgi:hypothetical protein
MLRPPDKILRRKSGCSKSPENINNFVFSIYIRKQCPIKHIWKYFVIVSQFETTQPLFGTIPSPPCLMLNVIIIGQAKPDNSKIVTK